MSMFCTWVWSDCHSPSLSLNPIILFRRFRLVEQPWKKLVFLSPCWSHYVLERCRHILSSLLIRDSNSRWMTGIRSECWPRMDWASAWFSSLRFSCRFLRMLPKLDLLQLFKLFLQWFNLETTRNISLPFVWICHAESMVFEHSSSLSHISSNLKGL